MSPFPMIRHQVAGNRLARLLDRASPPDLEVLPAPLDWRYEPSGDDDVEPDLVCFRVEDGDLDDVLRYPTVPVLLVEVFSPSGARIDRALKRDLYESLGVPHHWLVDPGAKDRSVTVTALHLVDGRYEVQAEATGQDQLTVAEPFDLSFRPEDLLAR